MANIIKNYVFFTENGIKEAVRKEARSALNDIETETVMASVGGGTIDFGQGGKFKVSKITYDKRIYYPGEVHVTLTSEGSGVGIKSLRENVKKALLGGKRISLVGTKKANAENTLKGDLVYVAKHYCVLSLSFNTQEKESVVIHAFSPDKKLTYDKYCNVYTGKKFGGEILNGELGKDSNKNDGIFKEYGIPFTYKVDYLQRLRSGKDELRQPYLVQYNESFYDFICRVANRCGEYLYYENGELVLGLPTLNVKAIDVTPIIYDCPEIDVEVDKAIITKNFYCDYTKKNSDSAKGNYYNSEVTGDEYFRKTTDSDKKSYTDIIGWWVLFSSLASGLQGNDLSDFISRTVTDAGSNLANAGIVWRSVKDFYKKYYINQTPDFTEVEGKVISLLSDFYHECAKDEEKATRNMTKLDFQANLSSIMLGNVVTICDSNHVVTRLHGYYDDTKGKLDNHNYAEVIPFNKSGKAVPPVGRVPHILKSSPQEARVEKTDDPLYLGRVRIAYLWQYKKEEEERDKDGKTKKVQKFALSPWIRMSVPFAGGLGGMVMTPEKDSHVMVNYVDNNIERPYIDGALYYAGQKPPTGSVELKDKFFRPAANRRVIASSSGHSISFIDDKGIAAFTTGLIPPVGQIFALVKGAKMKYDEEKIQSGEKKPLDIEDPQFSGGMVLRDSNDIYNISLSTVGRSISISSPFGKVDVNAFTGITINAPNGDVKIVGKNISLEAGNNISLVAGKNIRPKDQGNSETVGSTLGSIVGGIVGQILVGQSKNFLGFDPTKVADVSFLRCLWEVLLRPVEGTLSIKSNRNVTMAAGKGVPMIPTTLMSDKKIGLGDSGEKASDFTNAAKEEEPYRAIQDRIVQVVKAINDFYAAIDACISYIRTNIETLWDMKQQLQWDSLKGKDKASINNINNLAETLKYCYETRDRNNIDLEKSALEDIIVEDYVMIGVKTEFERLWIQIVCQIKKLLGLDKNVLKERINGCLVGKEIALDEGWVIFSKDISTSDGREYLVEHDIAAIKTQTAEDKKLLTRLVSVAILKRYNDLITMDETKYTTGQSTEENWTAFKNSIKLKEKGHVAGSATSGGLRAFGKSFAKATLPVLLGIGEVDDDGAKAFGSIKKLLNTDGCAGPRAVWDVVTNGNILISTDEQHTFKLNASGNGWEPVTNAGLDSLKNYLASL